jgi:hypothetical protein
VRLLLPPEEEAAAREVLLAWPPPGPRSGAAAALSARAIAVLFVVLVPLTLAARPALLPLAVGFAAAALFAERRLRRRAEE